MKKVFYMLALTGLCCTYQQASAQSVLNRLKQKVDTKLDSKVDAAMDKAINGKAGPNGQASPSDSPSASGSSSTGKKGRATNKGGEGLISTPPDVKMHLAEAETAYKAGTYGEARYAVRQAMLGVELEIGQKILKSMPETISGLKMDPSVEQVGSSGWGWTGLNILRQYANDDDKELRVTIANNAAFLAGINYYLTNGGYSQTTGGEQNWKQTKVKGHRAVIEYDESSGYKVTVPLGQSSFIVYEGVNFKNEQEIMAAANTLDVDGIKKMLGEKE